MADYTLVSVERNGSWKPAADVEILASWIEDSRKVSQAAASTEDPANLIVVTEVKSGVTDAVASVLRRYGDVADIVPGVWLVRARTTASALRNDLSHLLDRDDKLFVVDASRDRSAWFNFASDVDTRVRGLWRGETGE